MDLLQFSIFFLPAGFVVFGIWLFSWLVMEEEPKGGAWNFFLLLAVIWVVLGISVVSE